MKKDPIKMYEEYIANNWDRYDLIEKLVKNHSIKKALYPGSYIHITPSFLIPEVTYVDLDKKAKAFFKDERIYPYIDNHKKYLIESSVNFYPADYGSNFEIANGKYELVISQYAGFISQSCKGHLKIGGILLANNSHGDAGMAQLDSSYELIAVVNQRSNKWIISQKNLGQYFIPKKDIAITKEYLQKLGRGLGYTKTASAYIFKKKY